MNYNKENYGYWAGCVILTLGILFFSHYITPAFAQSSSGRCLIVAPEEPVVQEKLKTPKESQNLNCKEDYTAWNGLGNAKLSDNNFVTVELAAKEESNCLSFKNFGLNLPDGATVLGLQFIVEGHVEADGNTVKGTYLRLTNKDGLPFGSNKYRSVYLGSAWQNTQNAADVKWVYGHSTDNWNALLNEEILNHENFGVSLRIKNSGDQQAKVFIDRVQIKVFYQPVYSICNHDCITFFVADHNNELSVSWVMPVGFSILSGTDVTNVINIAAIGDQKGIHQICADVTDKSGKMTRCCKKFMLDDCRSGSIGDYIWNDLNGNSKQDPSEPGLNDVEIELFSDTDVLLGQTTSDPQGFYRFDSLDKGSYYLQAQIPEGFTPVLREELISAELNSDITEFKGPGSTDEIILEPGENITEIDFGFTDQTSDIGGLVWCDLNRNGIMDETEELIDGIEVLLYSSEDELIITSFTDEDGNYLFPQVEAGQYYLVFTLVEDKEFTLSSVDEDQIDSDVTSAITLGSTDLFEISAGGEFVRKDAGMVFLKGDINGIAWLDADLDGLQLIEESRIYDVKVYLMDESAFVIDSISTDENGTYQFKDLEIGNYYLRFEELSGFDFTISGELPEDLNSDVTGENGIGSTDLFPIQGGESIFKDAGYIDVSSDIFGIVWCDSNRNGVKDGEEEGLAEVEVILFDENGSELVTTVTDTSGNYIFPQLETGEYYLVFGEMEAKIFSPANAGMEDEIDSDVTEFMEIGSTDLFEISKGGMAVQLNAGYMPIMGEIQGISWNDVNKDGIRIVEEFPTDKITVSLYNMEGTLLSQAETNEDGFYSFPGLVAGMYYVSFQIKETQKFSPPDIGDDFLDSDVTESNGLGTTDFVFIDAEGQTIQLDAGVFDRTGSISGEVWLDANEDGIQQMGENLMPDLGVQLFNANNQQLEATTTNENGQYSFDDILIGTYYIVFSLPELSKFTISKQGSDESINSDVTSSILPGSTDELLISEDSETTNIDAGIIDLSSNIGGIVWIDNNGNGIKEESEELVKDFVVELYTEQDVLIDSDTTDNEGQYLFNPVDTGSYYLVFKIQENFFFTTPDIGFEDLDSDVTGAETMGSTDIINLIEGDKKNNVNAGIFLIGSISGEVWWDLNDNKMQDNSDTILTGVTVELFTENGELVQSTSSDENAEYRFENINPGSYFVQFTLPDNFFFLQRDTTLEASINSDIETINGALGNTFLISVFSDDMLTDIDAGVFEFISNVSTIGDLVWHDLNGNGLKDPNEPGLNEVMVILFDSSGQTIDITMSQNNTETGTKGFYTFEDISPGSYYLQFIAPISFLFSEAKLSDNDVVDSDVTMANGEGTTDYFVVEAQQNNLNIDAALFQKTRIGDFVWRDGNFNGIQDNFEEGIGHVNVELYNTSGILVDSTTTNAGDSLNMAGSYEFYVKPGSYFLKFKLMDGLFFTDPDVGDDDNIDSDVNSVNGFSTTPKISIFSGESNFSIDVGMLEEPGSIGDQLWLDINANGIFEEDEPGINDIKVRLFRSDGVVVDSTFTDLNPVTNFSGYYRFENVPSGSYYVEFVLPEEYNTSPSNQGGNDATDSDIINVLGRGTTPFNTISPGENNLDIDGGVYLPAFLGDFVWLDEDGDGIQDEAEPGIEGIEVILFTAGNFPLEQTFTDENGFYAFPNLSQGLYFIKFGLPEDLQFTLPKQGENDAVDSDAFQNGNTPLISLAHAVEFKDLDAGMIPASSLIGGNAWHDINGDGMQTRGEEKMMNVRVELHSESKSMVAATETDVLGQYIFTDLPEGRYFVKFVLPDKFSFTDQNVGNNDKLDSDTDNAGWVEMMNVSAKEYHKYVDAGMHNGSYFSANIWYDANADGMEDTEEQGIENIRADLVNIKNEIINSAYSSFIGQSKKAHVEFNDIQPGMYRLLFTVEDNSLVATEYLVNNGSFLDNDVKFEKERFTTRVIQLNSGEIKKDIAAGFYQGAKIGDKVWLDLDHNGEQNVYEPGMSKIQVELFSMYGDKIAEIETEENGNFIMEAIPKGLYYLKYNVHPRFLFSDAHMTGNSKDSDVTHEMGYGTTSIFELVPEMIDLSMDAGVKAGVLAISDNEFYGENLGHFNRLYIDPSSEHGVDKFILEKSMNAADFVMISEIKALEQQVYTFDDLEITEGKKYYYRVKEVTINEDLLSVSNIISIQIKEENGVKIITYPNPVTHFITLKSSKDINQMTVMLHHSDGQLIKTWDKIQILANQEIPLPIVELPKGSYILSVLNDGELTIHKIIKQ